MNTIRMLRPYLALCIFMLNLMVIQHSRAETLTFTTTNFPPFTIQDTEGAGKEGFINELVIEAFHRQGYTSLIKILPWARAQKKARMGEVTGSFNSNKTTEYEKTFLYSKPFSKITAAFFTNSTYEGPALTQIEKSRGLKVAANLGYSLSRMLTKAEIPHTTVRNEVTGLKLLLGGRVDTFLAYSETIYWNLERLDFPESKKNILHTNVATYPYYLIIAKSVPKASALIQAFDTSIAQMRVDGSYERIMGRYHSRFATP